MVQNTQFWLEPPQLPLQLQHEGPTPADILVGAFVPSAFALHEPELVHVAPGFACHSVMATQPPEEVS